MPILGEHIDSTVSYSVSFIGLLTLLFPNVTCNSDRQCALTVNNSQLASNERYSISVMASNAVSSGSLRIFPNQSG